MIKKYFALTLIAASVAVAGCSDDDDDNDPVVPPVAEHPDATPGTGGSVYDTIVNTDTLSSLRAAIDAAGLDDALDDESDSYTVFAPDNTAFEALNTEASPTALADLMADTAELTRVLQYHVVAETVDALALGAAVATATEEVPATFPTLLDGESVTVTSSTTANSGLAVDLVDISATDLVPEVAEGETTTGLVHTIVEVLTVPEATVPTEPTEPTEPTTPGTGGDVDATLAADGNYEIFRSAVARDFGGSLDTEMWTIFIPNDATLGTAGLSDLTAAQQQAHIVSSGALEPTALAGSESVTASNQVTYVVSNDGTTTTVDGKAVDLIATGAGGAQIYSIDGVLGAAAAK